MAINVSYQPNAMLLGQAAYDSGLGEYLLREQARQQAEDMATQRQVAAAGLRPPSQGRGGRDDYLARYAIMQRGALAEQENWNQLAALDMRGQYGLAEQNMRGQFGLQHEAMQQAGQNQREQWGNVSQSDIARRALIEKRMASDWQNIQKHLPYLNQAERDELIGKFHDRYRDAGMPMPVELPPQAMPEWMDPQKIWEADNAYYEEQGLPRSVPDENGMPSRRGAPQYAQTRQGMEYASELKQKEEAAKNALTKDQQYAEFNRKAVEADLDYRSTAENNALDHYDKQVTARTNLLTKIIDLRTHIATAKAKTTTDGTPIKIDLSEAETQLGNLETMYTNMGEPQMPTITPRYQPGPMSQGVGGVPQPMTPGMGGGQEEITIDPKAKTFSNPNEVMETPHWKAANSGDVIYFYDSQGKKRRVVKP